MGNDRTISMVKVLTGLMEGLEKKAKMPEISNKPSPGYPLRTGMEYPDRDFARVEPGELVVIGSLPGSGGTALALQIALNAARVSAPAWVSSTQIGEAQLLQRLVAQFTYSDRPPNRVPERNIRPGDSTEQTLHLVREIGSGKSAISLDWLMALSRKTCATLH